MAETTVTELVPLFRLPYVAYDQILKGMSLQDLFKLTLTTKKTRKIIKSVIPKNYFYVSFMLWKNFKIKVENKNQGTTLEMEGWADEMFDRKTSKWKVGGYKGKFYNVEDMDIKFYCKQNGQIIFFYTDRDTTWMKMINYIINVFNKPTVKLLFGEGIRHAFGLEILRNVKNSNTKIDLVWYDISPRDHLLYKHFLVECRQISQLEMYSTIEPGLSKFEFSPRNPRDFVIDRLTIRDAHWVKIHEFMQCKRLELDYYFGYSRLKLFGPRYLNWFLKLWIRKEDSRLEYIKLPFKTATDFPLIVNGLNENSIEPYLDGECLKIDRKDGRKAIVYYSNKYFYLNALENNQ